MRALRAPVVLICLICVTACDDSRWLAVVYRDRSNLIEYELAGEYGDLETCRAAALARLRSLDGPVAGDYECGRDCERDEAIDGWICEETAQ